MTFGVFLLYYLVMNNLLKHIIIILFVFVITIPSHALVLQGNAQFNAEIAKEEVFENIKYSLGPNTFRNFWVDPNYVTNQNALSNGQTRIGNRYIVMFSDGTYGVRYIQDEYHNYYYNQNGELFKVDVLDKPFNEYPHTSIAYNKYGSFKNATFVISKYEQYLYDINQKLMGHWVDDTCYDDNGNVLMHRKNVN